MQEELKQNRNTRNVTFQAHFRNCLQNLSRTFTHLGSSQASQATQREQILTVPRHTELQEFTLDPKTLGGLKPTECSAHRAVARLGSNPAPQVTDNILWNYSQGGSSDKFYVFYHNNQRLISSSLSHWPAQIPFQTSGQADSFQKHHSQKVFSGKDCWNCESSYTSLPACGPAPPAWSQGQLQGSSEGCDGLSLEHLDSGTSAGTSTCSTVWFDSD